MPGPSATFVVGMALVAGLVAGSHLAGGAWWLAWMSVVLWGTVLIMLGLRTGWPAMGGAWKPTGSSGLGRSGIGSGERIATLSVCYPEPLGNRSQPDEPDTATGSGAGAAQAERPVGEAVRGIDEPLFPHGIASTVDDGRVVRHVQLYAVVVPVLARPSRQWIGEASGLKVTILDADIRDGNGMTRRRGRLHGLSIRGAY